MEFVEKARIRLERWISHNDEHVEEYAAFARSLKEAGKTGSARYVEEMLELSTKANDALRKALDALVRE